MKSLIHVALAGAAFVAAATPNLALAQASRGAAPAATAASASHKVGLVDMAHIFSSYKKLEVMRKALQEEFKNSDDEVEGIQKELQAIQEELKSGTIAKGTEAWTQRETKFTELKASLQAKASNLQREFIRKEVAMYKEVHAEVNTLVQQYAEAYKYTLILRYQREAADETTEDPQAVMGRINQLVVYHQPADDITDRLLTVLNDRHTKQAGGTPAPQVGGAAAPTRR